MKHIEKKMLQKLWSEFPDLSQDQVKEILHQSSFEPNKFREIAKQWSDDDDKRTIRAD